MVELTIVENSLTYFKAGLSHIYSIFVRDLKVHTNLKYDYETYCSFSLEWDTMNRLFKTFNSKYLNIFTQVNLSSA